MPDREPDGVFDQGQHGDADSGVVRNFFSGPFETLARQGAMIRIAIGLR
jgi:hypothetical protein